MISASNCPINHSVKGSFVKKSNPIKQAILKSSVAYLALPVLCISTMLTTAMPVYAAEQSNAQRAEIIAQTNTHNFSVPSQALMEALNMFADQSDIAFAYKTSDLQNLSSNAVNGVLPIREALLIMLSDTGITATFTDVNTVTLAVNTASARRSNGIKELAPAIVESIVVVGEATNTMVTSEDLEVYQANDLSDIFRLTPSISVGGGASGIAQKIYIRGIEDALINVTVDGSPQTSTLFHHVGRVTIDPDLLKEVEVQAGAGEATSGAGAIGGSIRFKTKGINDLLASDESFGGRIKASTFTNKGEQLNASIYGRISDSWGVLAYYSDIDRENAKDGDGNELEGTAAEQTLGFIKVSGDIGDDQHLSLSYESRDEKGQFTARPNWRPLEGADLYDGAGGRDTFVANYLLQQSDLLNLEVSAYNTTSSFSRVDDRAGNDIYKTDITSYGFDLRNTSVMGSHRFIYGLDYRDDEVKSGYLYGYVYPIRPDLEEGQVLGVYAQGHSPLTDKLLLSYGARYDDYNFDQIITDPDSTAQPYTSSSSDVSINAGLAYNFVEDWVFSLGYAEAARGKEIGDGFTIFGTALAPDLNPETVSNTEVSLEYSIENFNAKVAVFHSEIDDVIFDQNGGGVYIENIGTVQTDGFEFDLAYNWNELDVSLGFASADSELNPADGVFSVDYGAITLEGYEYGGLGNSRGDTWNLGLNYNVTTSFVVGWNMTYVDDLNDIEVLQRGVELGWIGEVQYIDKPGYNAHDVYAEWSPLKSLQLNLVIINVFDETYLDHSSVADYGQIPGWDSVKGYNEPGRDIRLSVNFIF